jgi:cytoskeletal protein RodZ
MSLINDALKRAKEAQLKAPAPASPGPQLRPVEPAQSARRGLGLMLPVALGLVALFGLFLLWQMSRNTGTKSTLKAAAQTPATEASAAAPQVSPPPASPEPAVAARVVDPRPTAPQPAPARPAVAIASNTAVATTIVAAAPPAARPQETALTNTAAAALPSSAPPPLKLQAIVFNPAHPSVTISGKTLFVGERIGAFRVIAIGHDEVTLAGSGQTNTLRLDQ